MFISVRQTHRRDLTNRNVRCGTFAPPPGLAKTEGKGWPGLACADDDCVEAAAHGADLWLRAPDQVRPGRRVVTSWTIQALPSGSLKAKKDP